MAGADSPDGASRMQGTRVREGEFAGLPVRIAAVLHRRGYQTRAQVLTWYRADPRHAGVIRSIGPASVALIATWLGEPEQGRAR
jgi:hypothetical protein